MTHHDPLAIPTRAEALREATGATHKTLDQAIMAARPFDNVQNYGRFLKVQQAFHRDVAPLYRRADLSGLIADLDQRSRLDAITQDAADLGVELSQDSATAATDKLDMSEALGWLYVVEGSNLGAAFLFKAAGKLGLSQDHGARHLAEAPEGRAVQWRAFKQGLDAAEFGPDEEARVIDGANAAFARVQALVGQHMQPSG